MSEAHDTTPRMSMDNAEDLKLSSVDPYSLPLDQIKLVRSDLFHNDSHLKWFERLRAE